MAGLERQRPGRAAAASVLCFVRAGPQSRRCAFTRGSSARARASLQPTALWLRVGACARLRALPASASGPKGRPNWQGHKKAGDAVERTRNEPRCVRGGLLFCCRYCERTPAHHVRFSALPPHSQHLTASGCCLPARCRWARAAALSSRRGGRRAATFGPAPPATPRPPRRVPPASPRATACDALRRATRAHWRAGRRSPRGISGGGATFGRCALTRPAPQPAGEAANKWHDNVLEGAKRLSAEHLPPLREAAKRVASQAAERVPHSAKAVELGAGLWARLPEPAQKAAPPVAGALGVRAPARGGPRSAPHSFKSRVSRACRLARCARRSRHRRRCCCWAP